MGISFLNQDKASMEVIMAGILGKIRILKEVVTFPYNHSTPTVFLGLDFFFWLSGLRDMSSFDFNLIHGFHKGFHFLLNVTDKL